MISNIDFYYAAILGFIQGVTEFLPISSSGHLLLLHELFNFEAGDALTFDIALHVGTLLTICLYFGKDIINYAKTQPKLLYMAAISSIPAGIIGALFGDLIDQTFRFDWVVVIMLVVVAIIFLLVEKFSKQATNLEQLTWKQAMIMGCVQALALIPGTSRSGITMSFGMLFGLKRVAAARFSFIMVIPLLLGLTVKKGYDLSQASLSNHDLLVMLLGASVAAVVGLFCIRFLLVYFQRYTLKPFAYYRIILAVVVSLVLFL